MEDLYEALEFGLLLESVDIGEGYSDVLQVLFFLLFLLTGEHFTITIRYFFFYFYQFSMFPTMII